VIFGTGRDSTFSRQGRPTQLASAALAAALVILCSCALLGAIFSYSAGAAAKHAMEVSDAFDEARYSVGSEESLERKYRLEPSPEVRARHLRAADALLASLARARGLGADPVLIEDVVARHKEYLKSIGRMFEAIDAGKKARADEIDGAEVDPSFDAIETQVLAAAAKGRAVAVQNLRQLAAVQTNVLIAIPLVFIPSMGLVVFFWRRLGRYARQVNDGLVREAAGIRHSEQRFRALVQNTSDIILICSSGGMITYQSSAAETVWGYHSAELLNAPLRELAHPDDQPALQEFLEQVRSVPGTTKSIELQLHGSDGAWRHCDLVLTNLLQDPNIAGLVATARDISERKAFEKQLTHQAFYDSLTGLPNRQLFHDRLNQALARAGRRHGGVDLLFLDLDNFKQINDSLGHQAGDRLLAEAAIRLRACVREENTVARLGGDEFVILLEHLAPDADAVLVAERISEQFTKPFTVEGHDFTVSVSIGIALGNAGQERADFMLRDADVAMYRAKSSGKGCYVIFDTTMGTDILVRVEMENALRQAIRRNELRVHYQPIMILEGGRVAGVEALVRWQHPTRGLILPAEFIPVAEQTGIIVQLGQWVLQEACRQVVEWQKQYPLHSPLTVSVNLSPRQFQQKNLLEEVKRALRETGLPPSSLKLEITESVIMLDVEATITTLTQLKELGVQLAIDDFGTGYSSLSYLKRLPLDVLKIDRSFVNGIGKDREDTAIVRAIISMAKSLDLSITAEGIETVEQSALLRAWSCDSGQGYYFARPLDAADLTELLKTADWFDDSNINAA
jgi:diguanylate cyclase (GGDEF)-like protein/PAS domain S-box-containing protein